MTQIFYNLEEAAEKLKFSETILVRLSQYFKVPQVAYEDVGYLSFKGDLAFSEQDLTFFSHVKERLLLGESLDDVKTHLRENPDAKLLTALSSGATHGRVIQGGQSASGLDVRNMEPAILGGASITAPGEQPPMREIQDREPYEKAAEKSFERYKSMHRSSIGKVFENMLKEVGSPPSGSRPAAGVPAFRPMRSKAAEPSVQESASVSSHQNRGDAILPFSRRRSQESPSIGQAALDQSSRHPVTGASGLSSAGFSKPTSSNAVWEPLIHQAAQTPRSLNIQLKNAAILLRERALGHIAQAEDNLS
jgi:hypothetical protein